MSKIQFSCLILSKIVHNFRFNHFHCLKYFFVLAALMIFGTNYTYSQKVTYPKHQIGVGYSSFSGTGINYQIELDNLNAFQFSGAGYYFGDNPPEELDFYGILGAEYQFSLLKKEDKRFYAFAGTSMLHLERRRTKTVKFNDVVIIQKLITTDRIYNFGGGIGIEYKPLPVIAMNFGIGVLYQVSEKADFSEFWDRNPAGESFLGIGIGISLRYVF